MSKQKVLGKSRDEKNLKHNVSEGSEWTAVKQSAFRESIPKRRRNRARAKGQIEGYVLQRLTYKLFPTRHQMLPKST